MRAEFAPSPPSSTPSAPISSSPYNSTGMTSTACTHVPLNHEAVVAKLEADNIRKKYERGTLECMWPGPRLEETETHNGDKDLNFDNVLANGGRTDVKESDISKDKEKNGNGNGKRNTCDIKKKLLVCLHVSPLCFYSFIYLFNLDYHSRLPFFSFLLYDTYFFIF